MFLLFFLVLFVYVVYCCYDVGISGVVVKVIVYVFVYFVVGKFYLIEVGSDVVGNFVFDFIEDGDCCYDLFIGVVVVLVVVVFDKSLLYGVEMFGCVEVFDGCYFIVVVYDS